MTIINADPQTRQAMKAGLGWASALGMLMILIGIFAIVEPFIAAVAITGFIGFIFLMHGTFNLISAWIMRQLGAEWFILQVLLSLLYLIAAGVLLRKPFEGLTILTLIAGILIFIDGVIQVINAFEMKPRYGWAWVLFSGILGIILGILIWSNWPQSAAWVLGILVGVNLITNGSAVFMTSNSIRIALSDGGGG